MAKNNRPRWGNISTILLLSGVMTIITAVSCDTYGETGVWKEWRNSLKPVGKAGPLLTLTCEGKTEYRIVIPAKPTTQDQKAADDLAYWLKEMTGATFAIVDDSSKPQQEEINIGRTNRLDTANISAAKEDLGEEGYAIAAKDGKLFLLGGSKRGAINAVYALLEEDLGCRWYAGRSSRIPHMATLEFNPVIRSYTPALKYRDPYYYVAFDGLWSLRNRTNAHLANVPEEWGGHKDYALFVHSVSFLVPPGRYFKDHPEYFELNAEGKRNELQVCPTNEGAIKEATKNALAYLKENPNAEYIDVSKGDGGGSCQCPTCKKLNEDEGTEAASFLYFVNGVAEGIEKEYPNVLVETLAYLETKNPPKTMKPRRNVCIRVCTDRGSMWPHPFQFVRGNEDFRNALLGWRKISEHVDIWDYATNFAHWLAPNPNMDVLADNIRFFAESGVDGVMEQAGNQCPGTERDLMRAWVLAKLMWDPSRDQWELTQDFIWGYFGQAAPAITEYNALLNEIARDKKSLNNPIYRNMFPMDSPFLSKEFIDKATAIYDQAESLAENDEILRRVERDRIPIMYVQLERGFDFVDEYGVLLERFENIARREGVNLVRVHMNYVSQKHFGTFPGLPEMEYIHTLDEKLKIWKEQAKKAIKAQTAPGKTDPIRVYRYGTLVDE